MNAQESQTPAPEPKRKSTSEIQTPSTADAIREKMHQKGITQKQVAAIGFGDERNQPYVSALLSGKRTITRSALAGFCRALNCDESELDPQFLVGKRVHVESGYMSEHESDGLNTELLAGITAAIERLQKNFKVDLPEQKKTLVVVSLYEEFKGKSYTAEELDRAAMAAGLRM
jgi:transcriptional regulator with XRE-family HTH domain